MCLGSIITENTENCCYYQQLLFNYNTCFNPYIGAIILFQETMYQKAINGYQITKVIKDKGT